MYHFGRRQAKRYLTPGPLRVKRAHLPPSLPRTVRASEARIGSLWLALAGSLILISHPPDLCLLSDLSGAHSKRKVRRPVRTSQSLLFARRRSKDYVAQPCRYQVCEERTCFWQGETVLVIDN